MCVYNAHCVGKFADASACVQTGAPIGQSKEAFSHLQEHQKPKYVPFSSLTPPSWPNNRLMNIAPLYSFDAKAAEGKAVHRKNVAIHDDTVPSNK